MVGVATAGFRAIAPDCRGYGLSDPPAEPEKTSFQDMVDDLLAILDHLGLAKVTIYLSQLASMFNIRICFITNFNSLYV